MGAWFKIVLGLSPILGFVLYLVYQEYKVSDAQIETKHIAHTMAINEFNRDFELQLAEGSDNEVDANLHRVFAEKHIAKNEAIIKEKEEKEARLKELEMSSDADFASMEAEMESMDSLDDDFGKMADAGSVDAGSVEIEDNNFGGM